MSIFECAARVFDGWSDPETGLRVLKVVVRGQDITPRVEPDAAWRTWDHQFKSFLQGGRQLLARGYPLRPGIDGHAQGVHRPIHLIDLTTGEVSCPFPKGHYCWEVRDATNLAVLQSHTPGDSKFVLWDLTAERELSAVAMPGWVVAWGSFLCDERRAIVSFVKGESSTDFHQTRLHLLEPDGGCRQIHALDGYRCNHMQGSPTDPELFSYQRWPSPRPPVLTDEVLHIRSVDGSFEKCLPLLDGTLKSGPDMGARRDHYLWMPDGQRIASYLLPVTFPTNCSYDWPWWLSIMDWRTGEDLAVPYPPERWGGHFQVAIDGRHIIATGGRDFHKIFSIDVARLVDGWNERVLATYPRPVDKASPRSGPGDEPSLNRHPHMLPDQSGVVFTGGYPGPEQGIYMVEWPHESGTEDT